VAERADDLRVSVLENAEVAFIEGGDDVLFVVDYGSVQDHFFYLFAEDESAAFGRIGLLRIGILRSCGLGRSVG
jgi:hypothetical protein